MQRGPQPDATDPILQRLAEQRTEPSTEPLPQPDPVQFAPQPPYLQELVREDPTPVRNDLSPFGASSPFGAETPDWLAARLQEDAALRDSPQWSSLWKRRLVTWSLAAVLLALLAAGGLWVYQETQVEGALSVVANTTPATPLPSGPRALANVAPAAGAPVATSPDVAGAPIRPVTASGVPAAGVPAAGVPAAGAPAAEPSNPAPARPDMTGTEAATTEAATPDPRAVVSISIPPAAVPDVNAPVKRSARREREREHERAAVKQRRTVASSEPKPPAEPTDRRRREETLLQCRAHGYNERQCIQRSCVMTRFGLACKG
jgi:hypothetical protein